MVFVDETVIDLSKKKLVLLLGLAILLIAGSAFLLFLDPEVIRSNPYAGSPTLVRAIAWVSIVFFGLCGCLIAWKLRDRKPGLILHAGGLVDGSGPLSVGEISWSDIAGFDVASVHGQNILVINVYDPEKYANIGNAMQRATRRANQRMCGSPVTVSANTLSVDFERLHQLCDRYYAQYGR